MRDGGTNQPSPLAYRGTIYLNNTGGVVQALDARDGSLIWEHRLETTSRCAAWRSTTTSCSSRATGA